MFKNTKTDCAKKNKLILQKLFLKSWLLEGEFLSLQRQKNMYLPLRGAFFSQETIHPAYQPHLLTIQHDCIAMAKTLNDHGEIRIVITPTTTNDTMAEREYLMAKVFPHLIQLAEEREVSVNFLWNTPIGIDDVHQFTVSYDVAENPHPFNFIRNTTGTANKDRHFVDGIPTYEYETVQELGRGVEKGFIRMLDKLFPHTTKKELVKALRKVARIYQEFGQLQDSLEMHRRALTLLQTEYGNDNADTIEALYTCGWLDYKLDNYDLALDRLHQALESARRVYGEYGQCVTDYIGVIRMVEASAKRAKK